MVCLAERPVEPLPESATEGVAAASTRLVSTNSLKRTIPLSLTGYFDVLSTLDWSRVAICVACNACVSRISETAAARSTAPPADSDVDDSAGFLETPADACKPASC